MFSFSSFYFLKYFFSVCQWKASFVSFQNLDEFSGVSVLRACTKVNSEGKRCEDGTEAAAPACPDDPRRQDSATFGDFVTHETDEVINAETQRMQTGVCVDALFHFLLL